MKKFITALLSMAAISFAADVQILAPTGADFAPDAPNMVSSLVRAAVAQTGNTPVETKADVQLRTSLMTMGNSIVVVCEKVDDGAVVGSGKQKASSIDELDVAIEGAAKEALGSTQSESHESNEAATASSEKSEESNDAPAEKRPTHNYTSYGIGLALWHNYDFSAEDEEDDEDMIWDQAYAIHVGKIFETGDHGAITFSGNVNFSISSEFEIQAIGLIGGRFYFGTNFMSPYVGLGLGFGFQYDDHYDDVDEYIGFGLATGAEVGVVFFRSSAIQLEFGVAWDAVWDGFDAFDRRFGACNFYVALNL